MTWPIVSLDSLGEIYAGGTPSRSNQDYWGSGFKWLSIRDYKDFDLVVSTKEQITKEGLRNSSAKLFTKGSVIISIFATLGRVAILGENMATNQAIAAIKCYANIDNKYLMYCLKSKLSDIEMQSGGVAQKNINLSILKGLQIPLPPLETQKQIAAVLEKADQLRKDCKLLEQELNSLAQSVFIDMFGDPVTNPKSWEVKFFKDFITELRNGISPSKDGQFEFKVLTLSAVTQGGYNDSFYKLGPFNSIPEKTKKITKNDFLICRGNGNKNLVGRGVYPIESRDDLVFPDTVIAATIDLEKLDIRYVNTLWSSDLLREHIESGARTTNGTFKINQNVINGAPILSPPIELQKNFGEMIDKVNVIIQQNQKQLKELENSFNALMQKAFNGELNLDNANTQ